jgi:hypothetical protein
MMITVEQYFMNRDISHFNELTDEIRRNAETTVNRINELLRYAAQDGVVPGVSGIGGNVLSSGWRPASLNRVTPGAALKSNHIMGRAVDVFDTVNRDLARWCLRNLDVLERVGLWMEDPQWTPNWCHFQLDPPCSGRRVFIPSTAKPLCQPLPEQVKKS